MPGSLLGSALPSVFDEKTQRLGYDKLALRTASLSRLDKIPYLEWWQISIIYIFLLSIYN